MRTHEIFQYYCQYCFTKIEHIEQAQLLKLLQEHEKEYSKRIIVLIENNLKIDKKGNLTLNEPMKGDIKRALQDAINPFSNRKT